MLINPRAGRSNGQGLALAQKIRDFKYADTRVVKSFAEIDGIVAEFCEQRVDTICISSGDGTIQHVQTLLAEKLKPSSLPRLCLLPHGTTNMTAADIGFKSRSLAAQARFIADAQPRVLRRRGTLRISNTQDGQVRHGMFLGTGAIAVAAKYCQTVLNDRGVHGSWATGATLAFGLLRAQFSTKTSSDESRFDRPHEISLSVNGQEIATGQQLLALCTTLEKLILGSKPFWGGAQAEIRSTSLKYPMTKIVRWTYPLLFGPEIRRVPQGAVSASGTQVRLRSSSAYVLDGEFFEGAADGPLEIQSGPKFEYVVE